MNTYNPYDYEAKRKKFTDSLNAMQGIQTLFGQGNNNHNQQLHRSSITPNQYLNEGLNQPNTNTNTGMQQASNDPYTQSLSQTSVNPSQNAFLNLNRQNYTHQPITANVLSQDGFNQILSHIIGLSDAKKNDELRQNQALQSQNLANINRDYLYNQRVDNRNYNYKKEYDSQALAQKEAQARAKLSADLYNKNLQNQLAYEKALMEAKYKEVSAGNDTRQKAYNMGVSDKEIGQIQNPSFSNDFSQYDGSGYDIDNFWNNADNRQYTQPPQDNNTTMQIDNNQTQPNPQMQDNPYLLEIQKRGYKLGKRLEDGSFEIIDENGKVRGNYAG